MLRAILTCFLALLLLGGAEAVASPIVTPQDSVDAGDEGGGAWKGRATWGKALANHGDRDRQSQGKPPPVRTAKQLKHKVSKTELAAIEAMCREAPGGVCSDAPKDTSKPTMARAVASLDAIARTLIVRLQLPDPTPRFGPDPAVNEWRMAAVGYPLWLWTDGPTTVSSRVQAYGVTFTLRATWWSTTFDMGDSHRVTCTSTRSYPSGVKPGTKSPVCGYTYLKSSLPKGNYRVTATTNWRIAWGALGQSGTLPGSHTGSWSLPVGELNALVVR